MQECYIGMMVAVGLKISPGFVVCGNKNRPVCRNGGSNPENWLGFGVALLQLSELPKAHAMSEFQTRDPILQDFVTGGGSAPMGASARSHKFWERLVPLGQALL